MILLLLLLFHWVADFVSQSDYQALGKSKHWDILALHVFIYSAYFVVFGWKLWLITFCCHFITDAVTSRVTTKLWFIDILSPPEDMHDGRFVGRVNGNRHWFFVMIGFDQLLHQLQLGLTYYLLYGRL